MRNKPINVRIAISEQKASHPFAERGIRGNKLQVESSEQDGRSGSKRIPTFLETGLTVRKILSYME